MIQNNGFFFIEQHIFKITLINYFFLNNIFNHYNLFSVHHKQIVYSYPDE